MPLNSAILKNKDKRETLVFFLNNTVFLSNDAPNVKSLNRIRFSISFWIDRVRGSSMILGACTSVQATLRRTGFRRHQRFLSRTNKAIGLEARADANSHTRGFEARVGGNLL